MIAAFPGLSSVIHHLSSTFPTFTPVICYPPSVIWFRMKFFRILSAILRNKYLLTITVFAGWMLFFDKNDVFTQLQRRRELAEIEDSKSYFSQKIADSKKFSKDIQSDAAAIEKFARERYHMKRENEDLFLVQPSEKE
jgi:cell division protein FtsB